MLFVFASVSQAKFIQDMNEYRMQLTQILFVVNAFDLYYLRALWG